MIVATERKDLLKKILKIWVKTKLQFLKSKVFQSFFISL